MNQVQELTLGQLDTMLAERERHVKQETLNVAAPGFEWSGGHRVRIEGTPFYIAPEDDHPIRQLCRTIGMPYDFWAKNPTTLNSYIFETRFRGEGNISRKVRFKETPEGYQLLALLDPKHTGPTYRDVLLPMASVLPPTSKVRLANISSLDADHRLHLRVTLPETVFRMPRPTPDGRDDDLELGLFVDTSEDGKGTMKIATLLYRQICVNGAMVSYDSAPLLEFRYRGVAKFAVDGIVKAAIERFASDSTFIKARCGEALGQAMTREEAMLFVKGLSKDQRGLSGGFLKGVRKEIAAWSEQTTKWDVVNALTQSAQGLTHDQRVRAEFAAGQLLGLNLVTQ